MTEECKTCGARYRSRWQRLRGQPGAAGWKYHGPLFADRGFSGNRLELLKEILPELSRLVIFGTSSNQGNTQMRNETEVAAGVFGIKHQYVDILSAKEIETAFQNASSGRADAVFVLRGPVLNPPRRQVVQLAAKYRVPAAYPTSEFAEAGGLACCAADEV